LKPVEMGIPQSYFNPAFEVKANIGSRSWR